MALSFNGGTVGDVIFNPTISGGIGTPGGTLHVAVTDAHGMVSPFDYTLSNGDNFLTIMTTTGDWIAKVSLGYSLDTGFTDLQQIRVSDVAAVPEPSALALFVPGLAGLALLKRRRPAAI